MNRALPPIVVDYLIILKGKYFEYKFRKVLASNKQLENIHKGKRCFIIGNGPSINKVDLKRLRGEHTFVVNQFFQHADLLKIKPNYYCIIDREHFRDTKNSKSFFKDLNSKVNKDVKFFFPVQNIAKIKSNNILDKHTIHYLLLRGNFSEKLHFNTQLEKSLPSLINVMLACIIVASYMGFSEIYLLGVDHDWLKERNFDKIGRFYKKHYFNNDVGSSYEHAAYSLSELFRSYRLLKKKLKSTKIINVTQGSYLDVFEFKKLDQVLHTTDE